MFHVGEEMITRRNFILASVSAVACGSAGAARADAAAKAFIEKIYAAYKGKNSKGVSYDSDTGVRPRLVTQTLPSSAFAGPLKATSNRPLLT